MSDNSRIARNALMLYIRMFITMLVSLYTSRVILNTLGVSDYGLYNVVGGVVGMFGFLNGTLASGTQRFLTFQLGLGNLSLLKKTFSASLTIHFILACLIVVLAEVVGLWFLDHKMNIPPDRMNAAVWVFHFSVLSAFLSIMQVPYTASLIAHERMGVYAYMSIYDVVMKLLVVFLIQVSTYDKLILYAFLVFLVGATSMWIYRFYCTRQFPECRFRFSYDRSLYKEMLTFSGWNVFGCLAVVCNNQGVNILLNLFFSTIVNAAYGIASQISNVVQLFVNNFQTAVNPQIVKLYASGEREKMFRLVMNNSCYSTYLVLLIFVPLFLEMEFVLKLWLGIIPEYTVAFTRIILIQSLLRTISRPIVTACHATGKMKMPNLTSGCVLLLILPVSYILLKMGVSLILTMWITVLPWLCEILIDLYWLKRYIQFPYGMFMKKVLLKVSWITLLLFFVPSLFYLRMENGWFRFLLVGFSSLLFSSVILYYWAIGKSMQKRLMDKLLRILNR